MIKQGVAKKTLTLEKILFFQIFFRLLLLEGCLTKLTRKNFFSTYRVVFWLKIMAEKSKKWSRITFRRFFYIFLIYRKSYIYSQNFKNIGLCLALDFNFQLNFTNYSKLCVKYLKHLLKTFGSSTVKSSTINSIYNYSNSFVTLGHR